MYAKNVSGQHLGFCLVNNATGQALTGATVTVYRMLDGAAQAAGTGTVTEGGNGQYDYALSQADTNCDQGTFLFTATSAIPVEKTITTNVTTAKGYVGFDLASIANPTAAQNLTGTFIQGVNGLSSGSAAINTVATSGSTVTTGTVVSGTYASTANLNGVYWQIADSLGTLDMYFEFNVGTSGIPVSTRWTGHLTSSNDSLPAYAYNWLGTTWDQIGTLTGSNQSTDVLSVYNLTSAHVGTGSNAGIVRVRFANTGLTTSNFYTDQILLSYTISPVGIPNGTTITLTGSTINQNFNGTGWFLDLNGQDISGSTFNKFFLVSGISTAPTGTPVFDTGGIGTVTLPPCVMTGCGLTGTLTIGSAGNFILINCHDQVSGSGVPTIDMGSAVGATSLLLHDWSGGLTITNIKAGDAVVLNGGSGGIITLNGTGGTVEVQGIFENVVDLSGGLITITKSAVLNQTVLATPTNILSTALTESYAALGSPLTVTQALQYVVQYLTNRAISGTTMTIYKLDGTTPAVTLLTNSATNPTTTTRAT